MTERITSFPNNPPFGTTHYEHGRSWEYVEPGMWKSTAGAGATMDVYWDDILGKPSAFPPEDHEHTYDEINDGNGTTLDADLNSLRNQVNQIDQDLNNISGSLIFSGTVRMSTGVIDGLTDHGTDVGFVIGPIPADPPEGSDKSYFICEDDGSFAGLDFTGGDWLVSEGKGNGWTAVNFTTQANVLWDEIGDKPTEFPPTSHGHQISDVEGLQDALDNAGSDYDDTQIKADLAAETEARIQGDADLNTRIDSLDLSGGGDDYQYWRVQAGVNDSNPYNVESKGVLTLEGANGIEITRSGSYVTFSYAGNDLGDSFDNYQWWRFAIDGSNTTNVLSQQTIDFRAGDNISLVKGTAGGNYTVTISADVDLSDYYTKSQSDARYYPKDGIWIGTETQYVNLSNKQPGVLYFCT